MGKKKSKKKPSGNKGAAATKEMQEEKQVLEHPVEQVKLMLQVAALTEQLEKCQQVNDGLQDKNRDLKSKLDQQRLDQADIFFHLHKKLDRNQDLVAILEQERETMKIEFARREEQAETRLQSEREASQERESELCAQLESKTNDLLELQEFSKKKSGYEERIAGLEQQLALEIAAHKKEIADVEMRKVQEKERMKKDMLVKIKETKKNILTMTENQLDTTTKRTILEHEQMASELQYQSKATEKLLAQIQALQNDNTLLKRKVEMLDTEKLGHAKKANIYKNLSRNLASFGQAPSEDSVGGQQGGGNAAAEKVARTPAPPTNNNKQNDNTIKRVGTLLKEIKYLEQQLASYGQVIDESRSVLERLFNSPHAKTVPDPVRDIVLAILKALQIVNSETCKEKHFRQKYVQYQQQTQLQQQARELKQPKHPDTKNESVADEEKSSSSLPRHLFNHNLYTAVRPWAKPKTEK